MKRMMCIWIQFALYALPIYGQPSTKDHHKILYGVFYEYKHLTNKDNRTDTLTDQTLLLLSSQSSRFLSYSKLEYGISTYRSYEASRRMADKDKPYTYRLPSTIRCFLPEHYMFYQSNIHQVVDYPGKGYIYEADFPKIDWKLENDFKKILGLSCQRALGTHKGRRWEVWFAQDIPLPAGPWELNGLPGVILEAIDLSGEVRFTVKGIKPYAEFAKDKILQYYTKDRIELPRAHVNVVTKTDFDKIVNLAKTDRRAFYSNPQSTYTQNVPLYIQVFSMLWTKNQFTNPLDKTSGKR